MKYHGTDVDGPGLDPERLEVRGRNLNELIGNIDPVEMFAFVVFGTLVDSDKKSELETLMVRAIGAVREEYPAWQAAAVAARIGADPVKGMIAGLANGIDDIIKTFGNCGGHLELSEEEMEALLFFSVLPALFAAALGRQPLWSIEGSANLSYSKCILRLMGVGEAETANPAVARVFDAVLVSFQAGFGFLTPTVMLPRVAAGTRADLGLCLIAGLTGSGPAHVGACEHAMSLLYDMENSRLGGENASYAGQTVENSIRKFGRVPGFGHPLFKEDPRVRRIRTYLDETGFRVSVLQSFDCLCTTMRDRFGLYPNIDGISAAVFVGLNLPKRSGTGLFLSMRSAAMIAHVFEKRKQPPFGATSATAREYLASVPVGWI
jgi:citrate synthase